MRPCEPPEWWRPRARPGRLDRSRRPPTAAGHQESELLLRCVGCDLADDPPLVDHEDAVRERPDLLGLQRHEEDPAPGVALGDEPPMHELDRADVEAARGLMGDQEPGVGRDLTRDADLLLVAARQRRRERRIVAATDVVLL